MVSLPIVILSALVLALAGTVGVLGFRLHAETKNRGEPAPVCGKEESTQAAALCQKTERAVQLCGEIRRSLTHICTTIPSAIPGLSIARVRLLCEDELKDKTTAVCHTFQNGFSASFAKVMDRRDLDLLEDYIGQLASIAEEVKHMDVTLMPIFKAWTGGAAAEFEEYEQRLAAISKRLDELQKALQDLLHFTAKRLGTGAAVSTVPERIRKASLEISEPEIRAAMARLEKRIQQNYTGLDQQTKARMETYYLGTLELVLGELGRAERAGEDVSTRAELCIRVIHVLSNVMDMGQQARQEIEERGLEAEVAALERLAALRGDTAP